MFNVDAGKVRGPGAAPGGSRYCDGMSRRHFVKLGVAGMAAAGLPDVLRARAASTFAPGLSGKDTRVILVWMDGGPGHMDMYDMKPDAPPEYRGLWSPIKTNVRGIEISELFPLQAKVADKFSIVRSLYHNSGDHFAAGHAMLTGKFGASGASTAPRAPFFGAMATAVTGSRRPGLPAHAAVPYASSIGLRPGYFGANYVGARHNPFETDGDPNADKFKVKNLDLTGGMTVQRLDDRRGLREKFDKLRRDIDKTGMMESMDRFEQEAYGMVTSDEARNAFDISQEPKELRDRYGRNSWGQSMLLARRLAEAGVTFTSVHLGGWDHHWDLQKGYVNYLPKVDMGLAALFQDLHDRSLMKNVLVVVCGEFSRTPRMNDGGNGGPPMSQGTPGRDHWGNSMFALVSGGGLKMGQIVGKTDRLGESPIERPYTPSDLHATIYHVLGVDPSTPFLDHSGRPTAAIDRGQVIRELV